MFGKKEKGFTLIELLVVISIISLLSSIVISSLNSARAKARDARRLSDLQQIDIAIQLYISENGHAPYLGDELLCEASMATGYCEAHSTNPASWSKLEADLQPYISELPIDPSNIRNDDGSYFYSYAGPANITFSCDPSKLSPEEENRCAETYMNNNAYGLYAGKEATGGGGLIVGGTNSTLFSPGTQKSFTARIGSGS
jgi:prepilin-type N-terminal cleavage/methylation domain-containing protein